MRSMKVQRVTEGNAGSGLHVAVMEAEDDVFAELEAWAAMHPEFVSITGLGEAGAKL